MPNLGAEHENLDQKAYSIIKDMIIRHEIRPGDKIPQEKLARDLGISRTPLVNALKYLEKEMLIESKPRRGFFVRIFNAQEMIRIFELRSVLEGLAARRAARQISREQSRDLRNFFSEFKSMKDISDYRKYAGEDKRFHNFLISIGSQEFLSSILSNYNIIAFSYQSDAVAGLLRSPNETLGEHLAIIEAICSKDELKAEKLMRQHLDRSMESLKIEMKHQASGSGRR